MMHKFYNFPYLSLPLIILLDIPSFCCNIRQANHFLYTMVIDAVGLDNGYEIKRGIWESSKYDRNLYNKRYDDTFDKDKIEELRNNGIDGVIEVPFYQNENEQNVDNLKSLSKLMNNHTNIKTNFNTSLKISNVIESVNDIHNISLSKINIPRNKKSSSRQINKKKTKKKIYKDNIKVKSDVINMRTFKSKNCNRRKIVKSSRDYSFTLSPFQRRNEGIIFRKYDKMNQPHFIQFTQDIIPICIVLIQWIRHYLPELYFIISWIFTCFLSEGTNEVIITNSYSHVRGEGSFCTGVTANERYHAFLDVGNLIVNKKASSIMAQTHDSLSFMKLNNLNGSMYSMKYKYLSRTFMKKYKLGDFYREEKNCNGIRDSEHNYKEAVRNERKVSSVIKESTKINRDKHDLNKKLAPITYNMHVTSKCYNDDNVFKQDNINNEENITESRDIKNIKNMSFNRNSHGTTKAFSFNFGKYQEINVTKRRKKCLKRRLFTQKVITLSPINHNIKDNLTKRPKIIKKCGFRQMLGCILTSGERGIMSSRIIGAYPGDAVTLEEAGHARGVINLAKKYGYIECSNSDA